MSVFHGNKRARRNVSAFNDDMTYILIGEMSRRAYAALSDSEASRLIAHTTRAQTICLIHPMYCCHRIAADYSHSYPFDPQAVDPLHSERSRCSSLECGIW